MASPRSSAFSAGKVYGNEPATYTVADRDGEVVVGASFECMATFVVVGVNGILFDDSVVDVSSVAVFVVIVVDDVVTVVVVVVATVLVVRFVGSAMVDDTAMIVSAAIGMVVGVLVVVAVAIVVVVVVLAVVEGKAGVVEAVVGLLRDAVVADAGSSVVLLVMVAVLGDSFSARSQTYCFLLLHFTSFHLKS